MGLGLANSGKSYTMIGDLEGNQGILPKLISNLLMMRKSFAERKLKNSEFLVRMEEFEDFPINNEIYTFEDFLLFLEAFEIYNEEIFDLSNKNSSKTAKPQIFESNKKIFLQIFFFFFFFF